MGLADMIGSFSISISIYWGIYWGYWEGRRCPPFLFFVVLLLNLKVAPL